jgi:hypothetical protein
MRALTIAIVLCGSIAGAEAPRDCSKAAMRKARNAADKAMRAKDYKTAIAALAPLQAACDDTRDIVESAYLAGDLAVAYEKDGQPLECEKLMAPWSHPTSGLQDAGNDKLVAAIEYNLEHCAKDLDAQYAAVKRDACALTIDGAVAAAALPPALAPKGATAACIALVPGAKGNAGDDDVACPEVAVVSKGKGAKLTRRALGGDTGLEPSFCCNLSSIAVGAMGGKTLVRMKGEGRECSGGTGDEASDYIFEWKGGALAIVVDASVTYH